MTKSKDDSEQERASLVPEAQSSKEIEEILAEIPEEILAEIPENKRKAVVTVFGEVFSGPIPPPKMLNDYERIVPGAADRIIKMAENEQGIRDRANTGLRENDRLRIFSSTFTSAFLIIGALICASIGQPLVAIVLGSSGLISMIRKLLDIFEKK